MTPQEFYTIISMKRHRSIRYRGKVVLLGDLKFLSKIHQR